jgi:RHS repeat-associated protein
VKIEAYAKYESGGSSTGTAFASALLNAFQLPVPGAGEIGTPSSALNTWGGFVDSGTQGSNPTPPQAFVNIVVFDKNYNFLDASWDQVSATAEQIGISPYVEHDYMTQEYTIAEEGFVFLYISNDSPVRVYFDDVKLTYTPTNVVQYNEYYPFGLQTSSSWTRENNKNNFLYNAANELNQTTGWYEMFHRAYDPAIGRMLQVDPYATEYASHSAYNYALNSPTILNDPSGGRVFPDGKFIPIDAAYLTHFGFDGGSSQGIGSSGGAGRSNAVGPGSGNHWSDGIKYNDWTPNGGSDAYRAGLAAGLIDFGGVQYSIGSDGTRYMAEAEGGMLWHTDFYSENGQVVIHAKGVPTLTDLADQVFGSGLFGVAKMADPNLEGFETGVRFLAALGDGNRDQITEQGIKVGLVAIGSIGFGKIFGTTAKGISVIGPRSIYREFAKKIGANFLDVTDEAWTMRKNVGFLQGVVKRGDDVIFSGKYNPDLLNAKSVLAQEIRYLQRHGYSWSDDFTRLIKK